MNLGSRETSRREDESKRELGRELSGREGAIRVRESTFQEPEGDLKGGKLEGMFGGGEGGA
jgi:hypothetical protein